MEERSFVWTTERTKKMFKLRFEHEWLFKKKKQPWTEFRNILLKNGFPEEMTLNHVRKKWSYTYDSYRIAKRLNNKAWRYYRMFDKHFGKSKILDKYESWNNEWRLKLITCMAEAKELKLDIQTIWRTVEKAMRCQELPIDCCIQDMKGLWHHIIQTFNRKHRLVVKKGDEMSEWPLYDVMLDYFRRFDPEHLLRVETDSTVDYCSRQRKTSSNYFKGAISRYRNESENEFQWSKHITESFIQIRLQHDWLFREKKWAWNDMLAIMINEYGFPKTLNSRDICRKWASTYGEYQKAKATDNKSWVYYTLFELYLGEGRLSLNPLVGWQEEWVLSFINARTDLEHTFQYASFRNQNEGWREVEKKMRSLGIPLDHSLLDLSEIWEHLLKTFRWKRKFANKGILNEQWPYYEAMTQYMAVQSNYTIKKQKQEIEMNYEDSFHDDDMEDDMKLFDLKQRLQSLVDNKPKCEVIDANQCRSCSNDEGCVNIFDERTDSEPDIAEKLRVVGGIEVDKSDNLPTQICLSCLHELENAYKFRRKCQEVDNQYRTNSTSEQIKIEVKVDGDGFIDRNNGKDDTDRDYEDMNYDMDFTADCEKKISRPVKREKKRKIVKKSKVKYCYWKVCEVCGKHTKNLKSHLDMHSTGKDYTCEVCDKKFKFKSGLIIHKAKHEPTPRKTCEICGKTFHILAQYRRHFVYHANERKHECDTCGKRFNTLDILKVHKRMHTDERPFSCPECGKTFRTAGCVSRHKRIVHKNAVKVD